MACCAAFFVSVVGKLLLHWFDFSLSFLINLENFIMKKSLEERVLNTPSFLPADSKQANTSSLAVAASGTERWGVIRHARLPHRNGLPLSSGGGDAVER